MAKKGGCVAGGGAEAGDVALEIRRTGSEVREPDKKGKVEMSNGGSDEAIIKREEPKKR